MLGSRYAAQPPIATHKSSYYSSEQNQETPTGPIMTTSREPKR